jgi:hypothetical protein
MTPTAPALPAGSALGHSYEYGIDINLGTHDVPVWQPARRISNFNPATTPKKQPAQTYDDFGADNAETVSSNTNLAFAAQANRSTSTGLYLPEIEALLARTRPSAKGAAAVIEARWYHKPESGTPNPTEAGQGYFDVGVARANTGSDGAVEVFNFTLTGKGQAWEIANPFTGWAAAVPTIASASPVTPAAGTGDLLTLSGTGFSGTTAVTIGAIAADFTVVGDATLVLALPADTAGAEDILVTNATGVSAAFSYTRAA